MECREFGTTNEGLQARLYTIRNQNIELSLTDFGAALVSAVYRPLNRDIVQGFTEVKGYQNEVQYMGCSVGRVCNRISKGTFTLNGTVFHVPVNNGPNSLHGGLIGFSDRIWDAEPHEDHIIFRLFSKDGDQGYPGDLHVQAVYRLLEDGWSVTYTGTAEADTLFSMTNHAFFNLNGPCSDTALDHVIQTDADHFRRVDPDGQTYGHALSVEGTPFDFRQPHLLGERIDADDEFIRNGNGYDHHFEVPGCGMRTMVTCRNSDLTMEVRSDLPGFHLYSSNFLNGDSVHGKQGGVFPYRSSVCFETQYVPDAVNLDDAETPLLKKGETRSNTTEYHLCTGGINHECQ